MDVYSKILIVNPYGIGDVLFTTPLIQNLKENMPSCKIGFLCNKRTAPIIKNHPDIDFVFQYERDEFREVEKKSKIAGLKKHIRFLREIKKKKFDAVFDLSLNSTYGFFGWYCRIKKRIGFNRKNRGRFLTDKIDLDGYNDKHVVDYYLSLLRFLDIKPEKREMKLFLPPEVESRAEDFLQSKGLSEGKLAVITPGGGKSWGKDAELKHWPAEKFAKTVEQLADSPGCKIVLAGSKAEENIISKIAGSINKDVITAVGWDLMDFLGVLKRGDLLITNDGGPLHMAVSLGVKTVSIFGPVDEKVYGPYTRWQNNHRVVKENIRCRPCYRNFRLGQCNYNRKCLLDISVAEVVEAGRFLLESKF